MEVHETEGNLLNSFAVNQPEERPVKNLRLTDPMTQRTLCNIRNPKLKISRYTNKGAKCIDLQKFIEEINVTPDFGFDADDCIVEKEAKDPWSNMLSLLGAYKKQKALWSSVDEMNEIKKNYNRIYN